MGSSAGTVVSWRNHFVVQWLKCRGSVFEGRNRLLRSILAEFALAGFTYFNPRHSIQGG